MKKFIDLYKGRREFSDANSIMQSIKTSKRFDSSEESSDNACRIQLLDTPDQKTYLLATNKNIYKVIDDRRFDEPRVAWSRPRDEIASNNQMALHLEPYMDRTDKLVFDVLPGKVNYVSKDLFVNIEITDALSELLEQTEAKNEKD